MNNDTKQAALAARIEQLEHRAAIADLVHLYARNIRNGNGAACVDLFTEDGVFEIRDAPLGEPGGGQTRARLEGHDAITKYLVRGDGSAARVCPMVQNILIEVNGREATANSTMTATVWPDGNRIVGEYHDRFRYDTGWRFSSRTFNILGEFKA